MSAVFFSSYVTSFHSHNTIQLVLDTQKEFRFRMKGGQWNSYRSLIIKENVIHQLDTNNSVQLIIYLDAETEIAKAIRSEYLTGREIFSPDLNVFHFANSNELQRALVRPDPGRLENLMDRILLSLSKKIGIARTDERILQTEQEISTRHPREITIAYLADKVCLSESRLRSLFKEVTGISLYSYILSNKIRFATNQIMAGDSVYGAALEAGFTDGSHFHKMIVKTFGVSPSNFLRNNPSMDFVCCDETALHFETRYYNAQWSIEKTVVE